MVNGGGGGGGGGLLLCLMPNGGTACVLSQEVLPQRFFKER